MCETNDQFVFNTRIEKKYLKESQIKKNINKGISISGRNENFQLKKFDSSFPEYLVKNKKLYKAWII